MRHAGGRKESMKIQLGIAVLYACPGLTAKEAAEAVRQFFGPRATLAIMDEKISEAGGYVTAGVAAYRLWKSAFKITNYGGLIQVRLPNGRTGQGRNFEEACHDARNYVPYGS